MEEPKQLAVRIASTFDLFFKGDAFMSSGRYWAGVILGIIAGILFVFAVFSEFDPFIHSLNFTVMLQIVLYAYIIVSGVSQLIWWSGAAVNLLFAMLCVGVVPMQLPFECFSDGGGFWFLVGIALFIPCASFIVAFLAIGLFLYVIVSPFTYFHNLFSLKEELY